MKTDVMMTDIDIQNAMTDPEKSVKTDGTEVDLHLQIKN